MAEKGILSTIFGGGNTEVQIPAPPVVAKPKTAEEKPFDVERAKQRQGKFPPQSQLFLDTSRREGHLSNVALAALIDPTGYTLDQVEAMWNAGDVTEKSTFVVLTHGLLPPREVLRYEYSAELLSTTVPDTARGSTETEVVVYVDHPQSFSVNVPQGFRVYVFVSGPSLVEGRQMPESFAGGHAALSLVVSRHSLGSTKSDGSTDHTFGFMQRLAVFGRQDIKLIPTGIMRFIARAELVRI